MAPDREGFNLAIQILERKMDDVQNTYHVANQRTSTYLAALAVLTSLLGVLVQQVLGKTPKVHRLFSSLNLRLILHHPFRGIVIAGAAGIVVTLGIAFALSIAALKPITVTDVDNEAVDVAVRRGSKAGADVYVRDMISAVKANRNELRKRLSLQLRIGRFIAAFVIAFLITGVSLVIAILALP